MKKVAKNLVVSNIFRNFAVQKKNKVKPLKKQTTMNYQVKAIENGRGISLQGYKSHITLYQSDLVKLVTYNVTVDEFIYRADGWFSDIIGDEYGHENVKYDTKALEQTLRVVFKNLRNDFENSAEFSAEKEKELADNSKKLANLKKRVSIVTISNYLWKKYKLDNCYWAWSDLSKSSIAVGCRNKIHALHDTEKYIEEHLEEFAYLDEDVKLKKATDLYDKMLSERRK